MHQFGMQGWSAEGGQFSDQRFGRCKVTFLDEKLNFQRQERLILRNARQAFVHQCERLCEVPLESGTRRSQIKQ